MTDPVTRFLVYNLGASVLAGIWTLGLVFLAARLFGVTRAVTRNRLLTIPLLKSTLVLLALCTVMPFPSEPWRTIESNAIGFDTVVPVFLLLLGLSLIAAPFARTRVRSRLLARAREAREGDRSSLALNRVMGRFEQKGRLSCGGFSTDERLPVPQVFESSERSSVAIVDGDTPALILPTELLEELDDEELEGVLAHEVAHLALRRPKGCCDPMWLRPLNWLNPTSYAIGRMLESEEELACDELAAQVTAKPEALASALLKAYRFERNEQGVLPAMLTAQLLGRKGLLERRIHRLTEGLPHKLSESPIQVYAAWIVIVVLAFTRT